jgi:Flavodoxin
VRALIVYESMFGNTEQVARAIAAGLRESLDISMADVSETPAAAADEADLIVAGGPTHAFSMSRMNTREDAIGRGADEAEREVGLREWIDALPAGRSGGKLATFDTKVASMRHLPGSAAKGAARAGRRHGYELAEPAESFYVHDVKGPLLDGELERATAWGRELAASITGRAAQP